MITTYYCRDKDEIHLKKLFAETPELNNLFHHLINQWKLIVMGTRQSLAEHSSLSDDDCMVMIRVMLSYLFENYCFSLLVWQRFREYSPVEYEQIVEKLIKLPEDELERCLTLAETDTEKALDLLDTFMAASDTHLNNGQ